MAARQFHQYGIQVEILLQLNRTIPLKSQKIDNRLYVEKVLGKLYMLTCSKSNPSCIGDHITIPITRR